MSNRQPGRPMKVLPQILEAASRMFLAQGLDISLDAIATEAGTTRQTLYNHFPSKDALVLAAFSQLSENMQPPLKAMLEGENQDLPSMLTGFACVVQAHFFDTKNIHFHRLLIQLLLQRPELYATFQQRTANRVLQSLSTVLQQAHARGEIQVEDSDLQAAAFLGAVMGYPLPAALVYDAVWETDRLKKLAESSTALFLKAWGYRAKQ